uniref:Uncharacterized protein n=1 Tax=Eptatretus burgeri TaxID=7764 RepID=A0A8C4QSH9_EPTBU
MFQSTEGHNQVIAVAGTWTDILASCLWKSQKRNNGALKPGQDSCPESSHCLLPPPGVTWDDLERYWCLIVPGEDGMWREKVLSVLSFTPESSSSSSSSSSVSPTVQNFTKTTPRDQTETTTQNGRTQQQKIIIPAVIVSALGLLLIVTFTFVFCFRRRHKENFVVESSATVPTHRPAHEARSEYENDVEYTAVVPRRRPAQEAQSEYAFLSASGELVEV